MATTRKASAAKLHILTERQVQAAAAGDHSDGGGLLPRVRGDSASWVFRYTDPTGRRRREMGLGTAHRGSTEQAGRGIVLARDLAHKARELLRQERDPIAARNQQRADTARAEDARKAQQAKVKWTLARASRDYHERVIEPNRTAKHSAQWIASLENHVCAALWNAPVAGIEAPALLSALLLKVRSLEAQGQRVPETVQRIRQRLDAVFEDAIFHKRCTTNPAAAIRRKMTEGQSQRERGMFRALPYREAPAFMATLRAAEGIAARCLEFTVLTAARTSESLLALGAHDF